MQKINIKNIRKGDHLLYIPKHLPTCASNGEKGIVTMIDARKNRIWVKFKGPQGELTPVGCLWKCQRH